MVISAAPDVLFLFDFGSPNAYLAHRLIPGIEMRTGVRIQYFPILLGGLFKLTGNQSPASAFANIPNKFAYERLETQRFIGRHNLHEFQWNPHFPVNTLSLMRGAVAAQAEGVFEAYTAAMFHFMWEEPRKLDDPSILAASLTQAGLPVNRLLARGQDKDVKDRLIANKQVAFERGAFGAPSFFVGDQLYFGKDRLRDVEDVLALEAACLNAAGSINPG